MTPDFFATGLAELSAAAATAQALGPDLVRVAGRYQRTLSGGGKIFFAGNGGSAADAEHIATEFVVRLRDNREALAAQALVASGALMTAAGNDLGFENIYARQLQAWAKPGDLLVLHSTSGASPNLLAAARTATRLGVGVVAFLGAKGGELEALAELVIRAPSENPSHIQELHIAMEHLLVAAVEQLLRGESR